MSTGVLVVLWGGLLLTLSRSSLAALLVGLATLAALRWEVRRALYAVAVVIALGAGSGRGDADDVRAEPGSERRVKRPGEPRHGRPSPVRRPPAVGLRLGFVPEASTARTTPNAGPLAASHTIPVTIAAEQGLIGEIAYVALVVVALVALLRGARGDPVRAAIAAAFLALVFHTMLYADFLEDPVRWALLGAGMALARAAPQPEPARRRARTGSPAPQPA